MNRVTAAIARTQSKLDTLPAEKRNSLNATMAVDAGEHFAYQQNQAQAHVSGKLSADEAMIVYVALGEVGYASNGGWAKDTDLATKVVVTTLMGELIRAKLGR